jgi:hypothetical protein
MRGSTADPVSDLREIAAQVEELVAGAEAGNYQRLADVFRMALDEVHRQAAPDRLVENRAASGDLAERIDRSDA